MSTHESFLTDRDERAAWLAFLRIPRIGPGHALKIREVCGTLREAWSLSADALRSRGVPQIMCERIERHRPTISPDQEYARMHTPGVGVTTWKDADYPRLLEQIPDPPYLLTYRGDLDVLRQPAVAVVGTRTPSSYGVAVTRKLVAEIAEAGVTIVSGLALGIDAIAHRSAIEAGGKTIAVLGSGLDRIYPPSHRPLADHIAQGHGALLSEFPPDMGPDRHHFPLRNRIIAGLARATLVIEGNADSGSLITARIALDYNREVLAVPGDIFRPTAVGPNQLLALGARVVTSAHDVLEILFPDGDDRRVDRSADIRNNQRSIPSQTPSDPCEQKLFALLSDEARHVDELVKLSGLPTSTVSAAVTMLELQGFVRHLGGMRYIRA